RELEIAELRLSKAILAREIEELKLLKAKTKRETEKKSLNGGLAHRDPFGRSELNY
ncbi:MAG: hypothetical protein Q9191_006572, partial [Dirinaria sp. TL-2023a]